MVIRKDLPFDGACYHIVLRGNNRSRVLNDPEDKQYFLSLLNKYRNSKNNSHFELFHYCLMNNHAHLILRIIQAEKLAKVMQGINQSFTNHWKRTREFVGCLWQGPYRRFMIDDSRYLLECGRYVERNPLRAKLVTHPDDYLWSSYRFYASGIPNDLITPDPEYLALHIDSKTRQELYREYVETVRPHEDIIDQALMTHTLRRFNPWRKLQI